MEKISTYLTTPPKNTPQPQAWPDKSSPPVINECVCDGSGHFRIDIADIHHPWFGRLFRCICKQVTDITGMQESLGTPTRDVLLKDIIVGSEASQKMKANAQHFIAGLVPFLTLWGTNGTGKTTTLMAIANELTAKGTACVYVTAADVMEYIKDGIGDQDNSADHRVGKIAKLSILCLDEISQVKWTEYVSEKLETILDRRYRMELQTALALDQDPQDVLPPRFYSRMRSGAIVQIGDPDKRPVMAQQMRTIALDRGRGE